MSLVLEEAEEIQVKKNSKTYLGRIIVKGDNITLLRPLETNFSY